MKASTKKEDKRMTKTIIMKASTKKEDKRMTKPLLRMDMNIY